MHIQQLRFVKQRENRKSVLLMQSPIEVIQRIHYR